MKFTMTLKDPDGAWMSINEAASLVVGQIEDLAKLTKEEKEFLIESRQDALGEFCSRWVEYGEYVSVEFDTEAGTATVLEK